MNLLTAWVLTLKVMAKETLVHSVIVLIHFVLLCNECILFGRQSF
jgi:hypothetical protein